MRHLEGVDPTVPRSAITSTSSTPSRCWPFSVHLQLCQLFPVLERKTSTVRVLGRFWPLCPCLLLWKDNLHVILFRYTYSYNCPAGRSIQWSFAVTYQCPWCLACVVPSHRMCFPFRFFFPVLLSSLFSSFRGAAVPLSRDYATAVAVSPTALRIFPYLSHYSHLCLSTIVLWSHDIFLFLVYFVIFFLSRSHPGVQTPKFGFTLL